MRRSRLPYIRVRFQRALESVAIEVGVSDRIAWAGFQHDVRHYLAGAALVQVISMGELNDPRWWIEEGRGSMNIVIRAGTLDPCWSCGTRWPTKN